MSIAEALQLMISFGTLIFTITIGIITLVVTLIVALVKKYTKK